MGEDAHIAGTSNFLTISEEVGWKSVFLGPAMPIPTTIQAIKDNDPELVAVSYRLTPETGETLLKQFIQAVKEANLTDRRHVLGGTPPLVELARELKFFSQKGRVDLVKHPMTKVSKDFENYLREH